MTIIAIHQPLEGPLAITKTEGNMTVVKAERAVPKGLPFKLIDESEILSDKTFRESWEWDGDLSIDNDGYGGGVVPA